MGVVELILVDRIVVNIVVNIDEILFCDKVVVLVDKVLILVGGILVFDINAEELDIGIVVLNDEIVVLGDNNVELADEGSVFEISETGTGKFYIKLSGQNRWLQHSGTGNGIRFWTDTNNAANSSVYMTFASSLTVPEDVYGLDGKTCGLLNHLSGLTGEALMSEAKTTASLKSLSLEVRSNPEDSGESLYVAKDSGISMWTFHSVREDLYTLSATIDGETKYLKIDNTGLSMVNEQDAK